MSSVSSRPMAAPARLLSLDQQLSSLEEAILVHLVAGLFLCSHELFTQGPEWVSRTPNSRALLSYTPSSVEASEQLLKSKGLAPADGFTATELFSEDLKLITVDDQDRSGMGRALFYSLRVDPACDAGHFLEAEAEADGHVHRGWLTDHHLNAFGGLLRKVHYDGIVFVNSRECKSICAGQDPYTSRNRKNLEMMVRYAFNSLFASNESDDGHGLHHFHFRQFRKCCVESFDVR